MSLGLELLVSDSHGIYVPQRWAMYCQDMDGVSAEDMEILKAGPDHEWYWDAWNDILSSAEYVTEGNTYRLHQDGDLWAVCYEQMSDDEYRDFFGEERN